MRLHVDHRDASKSPLWSPSDLDVDVEQVHHPLFLAGDALQRPMTAVCLVRRSTLRSARPLAIASGSGRCGAG
jgi:hypothetical protein